MRKYAIIDNNIITEVLDLEDEGVTREQLYHSLVIDIQDLNPIPEVGWELHGNTLIRPNSDLTLEQFPQGLQGYYDFHWRRMGMTANPLPVEKIKIVYILGEVREPVSRRKICDFSGEDEYAVQQVLNEWKQFLHELMKEEKRYSVYHSSFRDFLHRNGHRAPVRPSP